MTEDEQIDAIIRASDAGQWLIGGTVHTRRGVTWAKFKRPDRREIQHIETAWETDSTVTTVAQDLIGQVLSKG